MRHDAQFNQRTQARIGLNERKQGFEFEIDIF